MNIVVVGHVDHGKSTVIGRLLADTDSLPKGKLEQVKLSCQRSSRPFEYAFLIDALKDEQSQGITIDSARVFFKTEKRDYIIIDAPGHIEFLKNMVTGASRAEAALLVIDAFEGVRENSRRHGYMLSMLGVSQVAVVVNKMDLVDYDQAVFTKITKEYSDFLKAINILPVCFIPVSAREGDNITDLSKKLSWHKEGTVLKAIDSFKKEEPLAEKSLRLPVQDIYKFTKDGDNRRIVVGEVVCGEVSVGDNLIFYPSGKRSTVKTIETFNVKNSPLKVGPGHSVGFTLSEQIYLKRGELAVKAENPKPQITTRIVVSLFWLGKDPLLKDRDYILKIGTSRSVVRLEKIERIIDSSNLAYNAKPQVDRHDVAECVLKLAKAIAFDLVEDSAATSRFVIVDGFEISGGGIIRKALEDDQAWLRDKVLKRDYKWEKSKISKTQRSESYNQKPSLILLTGPKDINKKEIAKELELSLFKDNKFVYFIGIGSVLYGVDSDIERETENRKEHLRRFSEVLNILIDSGLIVVVTASGLDQTEIDLIRIAVGIDEVEVIWVAKSADTDVAYDIYVDSGSDISLAVYKIRKDLTAKGI
ncbi:MAG: GTP-binding protein [Candidatus Omnitrophica bacterium]|nr:GTP-binding protein [Candidatus Omnitrophota bacterium]